jgi:hypothetical protein
MIYDQLQTDLARSLAPNDCDRTTLERAFAILSGAAAACASRLAEPVQGQALTLAAVENWQGISSALLEMADFATPDTDWKRNGSLLELIVAGHRARLRDAGY